MEIISASQRAPRPRALIDIWNACIGQDHPLEPALLSQHLRHPYFQPELFFAAYDGDDLLGFAAGSAPAVTWRPAELGHLSYLAVAPEARRRGIGARLYDTVTDALAAQGIHRLRLAGDPNHLLPGMPSCVSPETWRFFVRRGFTAGGVVHDLHLDLGLPLPPGRLADGLTVTTDDPEGVLRFLDRVFPGRWRDEAEEYLLAGASPLGLAQDGEIRGFACVFPPDSPVLGPSRHWQGALPGPVAGLGPIGIDPGLRGRGQGLAFFVEAAKLLQNSGARHLIVNWTDLTGFYGRAGARIWRSYQGVHGTL
ncbi:MAG TPA: GNAT family N-acetyltransferase [Trueperaceae bacterium]